MPKQLCGNVWKFKTKKLYDIMKNKTFGELLEPSMQSDGKLSEDPKKEFSPEELDDYVDYKIAVYRGLGN